MPRQAIALLVHKDTPQALALVKMLENDFDVYIHIDAKCSIGVEEFPYQRVWKKYKVHWGGYDMVQATVFLYKKILASNIPYTHVILLSGDSMPVKSNEYISSYLNMNTGISFIENKAADELCLERRRLFWYKEDLRKKVKGVRKLANPFRIVRWIQRKLNITRSTAGFERTGSQWTILAMPHVRHLIDHCPLFKYRFMAVPDESFVQNHFTEHQLAYSKNLIYAHWPTKRSFSPDFIDEHTFISLLSSPYLFARKFEYAPSAGSVNKIIKNVEGRSELRYTWDVNKLESNN